MSSARFVVSLVVFVISTEGSNVVTTEMAESYRQQQLSIISSLENDITSDIKTLIGIKDTIPKDKSSEKAPSWLLTDSMASRKSLRENIEKFERQILLLKEARSKLEDTVNYPINKLRGVLQLEKSISVVMAASLQRDHIHGSMASMASSVQPYLRKKNADIARSLTTMLNSPSKTAIESELLTKVTVLANALRESVEHRKAMKLAEDREAARASSEEVEQAAQRAADIDARRRAGIAKTKLKRAEQERQRREAEAAKLTLQEVALTIDMGNVVEDEMAALKPAVIEATMGLVDGVVDQAEVAGVVDAVIEEIQSNPDALPELLAAATEALNDLPREDSDHLQDILGALSDSDSVLGEEYYFIEDGEGTEREEGKGVGEAERAAGIADQDSPGELISDGDKEYGVSVGDDDWVEVVINPKSCIEKADEQVECDETAK
jgi:hypothetical protein